MDYLTETDQAIMLSGALGLCVGLAISAQNIWLDQWLKEEWLGWDDAISRTIVSAIVWAILLSAIAFLSLLYEPMKSAASIERASIQFGIVMGLLLPITRRGVSWVAQKVGNLLGQREV